MTRNLNTPAEPRAACIEGGSGSGLWRSLFAARRAHARDQSGYVLGVVLAAMTVGLLLITALLSLSFATHRAAIAQQQLAREQRAADGGLETALARIRVAANSGSSDLCAPLSAPDPEIDEIDFDSGTTDTGDDVTVRMDCDEVLGNGQGSSDGSVEVVGDNYSEVPGVAWDGWPWDTALGSTGAPDPTTLEPTLVHNADQPLLINGNMSVRKGAAPLLNIPGETGAVDVSRSYVQGDPGYPGTGQDCGMLDLGSGLDGDLTRTAIIDDDTTPTCGDNVGEDSTATMVPTRVTDGPTGTPGVVPSCPGSGPGTVQIPKGDYNGVALEALNDLFDGGCTDKLFWFEPGNYWFAGRNNGDALTFADDGSAFVFGTLKGSGPTATCDPEAAAGARIVLSGTTTVNHQAGNVSICANGGEGDAIVQSEISPGGITLSNATTSTHRLYWAGSYWVMGPDFPDVAGVNPGDPLEHSVDYVLADADSAQDAMAAVNCAGPLFPWQPWPNCELSFSVDLSAEGDRPINNLKVAWTSSESPPSHGSKRGARVAITAGSNVCNKDVPDVGRTPGFITAVDLTSCFPGQPESALNGARMKVTFYYRPPYVALGGSEQIRLNVRGLNMIVNSQEVQANAASSPDPVNQWADAAAAISGDPDAATHPEGDCYPFTLGTFSTWVCDRTEADTGDNDLVIGPFDLPAGLDENDQLDRLLLAIDTAGGDNVVANGRVKTGVTLGRTRVHLDWPGGSCDVPADDLNTYTRSANTYMIDLVSGGTECASLRGNASVLTDLHVRLRMNAERGSWFGATPLPNVGLQLPKLKYVRLVATTDSASAVLRGHITSDGPGTRFRVHGDIVMPRISLDVHWNGPNDTNPIVSGSTMQVHSIGSTADGDGTVGVLCCRSGQREARIVSSIEDDGGTWVPRGVARAVIYRNTSAPLADITVTGWQFCGGGDGCVLPAGGVLGPPP